MLPGLTVRAPSRPAPLLWKSLLRWPVSTGGLLRGGVWPLGAGPSMAAADDCEVWAPPGALPVDNARTVARRGNCSAAAAHCWMPRNVWPPRMLI